MPAQSSPSLKHLDEKARRRAAVALAKDLLDWDAQFAGPADAECNVAGEDMARWVKQARKVVGK